MSRYINLFSKKNQSVIISSGIRKTKSITFRVVLILGSLLILLYALQYLLTTETDKLEKKKRIFQTHVQNSTDREKEIVIMDQRKKELKEVLENDITFVPYYLSLRNLLRHNGEQATPSAQILNLTFSDSLTSELSLYSKDYDAHVALINLLESEESEKVFESVLINGTIYIDTETRSQPGYVLNTDVTFKDLSDETL
jgi:hypothetical protein